MIANHLPLFLFAATLFAMFVIAVLLFARAIIEDRRYNGGGLSDDFLAEETEVEQPLVQSAEPEVSVFGTDSSLLLDGDDDDEITRMIRSQNSKQAEAPVEATRRGIFNRRNK